MKVLHVIPAVAARYGGPSRAVFEMCGAVAERGMKVLVATTDADGPGRLAVETGTPFMYEGVETIFFARRLSERFGYSRGLARWLKLNAGGFDVAHIHAVFSHPCVAAARACRLSRVPYVVRPLGSLDPWSMKQKPWRKRLLWHAAAGRMLREAAAVHYTTLEERRLAESTLGLTGGVVIPLGVEAGDAAAGDFWHRNPALGNGPYVLALTRLHPKKNLESLIAAFLSLSARGDFAGWRLIVAGDGEDDYVARLKRCAAGSPRIVFTGWLGGEDKALALRGAELLALPSRQENFGLCVAEALARGVPVLVSRQVNLAAEIEEARAGWVTGMEQHELERALAEAMSDANERERRGRAGRDFAARHLAWPRVAAQLVALYQSIINRGAEPAPASQNGSHLETQGTH
ncbi:MAG TPA: glycosyltransferase [Pyrinomonadaceae bacterium]|nr:glycosyltransferase [Pyrinomonadaceae bacterium]